MRIQHVVTKADVGGAQTYVLELATAQVEAGHSVRLLVGTPGRMSDEAERRGIIVEHEPDLRRESRLSADIRAGRAIAARLFEWQPDVVHAHSSKAGLLTRLAARRHRVPAVYTAHGWPFQAGAPAVQRLLSWTGETAAARWWGDVICLTEAELDLARRRCVVSPNRLHLVPNGLPDVSSALRADLRRESNPTDPSAIVMVARFAPPKQQRKVLRSLAMITELSWQMTFVGDGPELEATIMEAQRLGIADRVRFAGDRADVNEFLASCDIGVLCSRYEGMPLALLEKMRAGLACVANDLPGVRALFGAEGGIVVAAEESALAEVLADLLGDSEYLERQARTARRRYESEFSIEANHAAVMEVYRSVIRSVRR